MPCIGFEPKSNRSRPWIPGARFTGEVDSRRLKSSRLAETLEEMYSEMVSLS